MPTYEYRCKSCGYEFEEFQQITADPLVVCPKCAEPSLKRIMGGGAGMIFKGSGFYLTDYKKNSASPSTAPKPDSKPKKDASGGSSSKPSST